VEYEQALEWAVARVGLIVKGAKYTAARYGH
jgi:hypothetical protein